MGHKINPTSMRLAVNQEWRSRWFNQKKYPLLLEEDFRLREWLDKKLVKASLESVDILRSGNAISIIIKSARPGIVIGRGGKGLEELQQGLLNQIAKIYRDKKLSQPQYVIKLEIEEIKKSELYAKLVAKNIAEQLEKRMHFRRVLKQTIEKVFAETEIKGIKINVSGRLDGAEIAREEHLSRGSIPLQSLRANISYAQERANTTYGAIGIKVWLYKGDTFADVQIKK